MNKIRAINYNLKALYNYKRKNIRLDHPPTYIYIEPTNHCNLKCIMCPNGQDFIHTNKGYMEFELYQKIIDEIKPYASTVVLSVGGESLLHPQFTKMVKYATNNKIKTIFNTNATLLDHRIAQDLLQSGITAINFSFDGYTKSMYEKARIGADFDNTLNNIIEFLKLKKEQFENGPYCTISILKLELEACSDQAKNDFVRRFTGLIDEIRIREVNSWGGAFKDTDTFSHRDHDGFSAPCARLWSTACITWDGNIIPCVFNMNQEYRIGNLKEDRFLKLWNHSRMIDLRKAMIEGSHLDISPICDNCVVMGNPPILGIPSGIRLTLSDSLVNYFGYNFEKQLLKLANALRAGSFSSQTLSISQA